MTRVSERRLAPRSAKPAPSGAKHLAAVDGQGLPGDPAGERRCEEERDIGDLLRAAEPAEGNALEDALIERRIRGLALLPGAAGKLDRARRDAIDADALAREERCLRAGVMDRG